MDSCDFVEKREMIDEREIERVLVGVFHVCRELESTTIYNTFIKLK